MTLLTLILCQSGFAATHTVDAGGSGDFETIQSAIEAASSGDTIEIGVGTYTENVSISAKTLTITGAGAGATIIEGDGTDTAFSATSGGLSLSHVTVTGGSQGISLRGLVGSMSGVEIDNNSGSADGGGVAITDGSDINLSNVIITDNSGNNGGGLYLDASSVVELTDSWLEGNQAGGSGGAAHSSGNFKMVDSEIRENSASDHGGGVFATGLSPEITGSNFWGNQAGGNGGGIAISETSTGSGVNPRIKESEFWINEAGGSGGGLWLDSPGTFYLKQLLIVLNSATGDGGGLWLSGGQSTNTFLRVWHNSAESDGGGAYIANVAGGETRKSSFGGNHAGGVGGGAIHKDPEANHPVYNNRYIENTADAGAGLVIDNDPSKRTTVSNIDVFGNAGGGISIINSAAAKVVNAIVAWNDGIGVAADETSAGGATLKFINAYENESAYGEALSDLTGADGNIDQDPLYTRAERDGNPIGDFLKLTSESPCLYTGKADILNRDDTRSHYGSYGGPGAEGGDEDGDGVGPNGGDCDDGDAAAAPGLEEIAGDGRDNDCAGGAELDIDGDGSLYPLDCDDEDPDIAPGMTDVPGDGIDADCDGLDGDVIDTGEPTGADTGAPWVDEDTGEEVDLDSDVDGDGFSDDDCNDADASAYPGAKEICDDGIDNDCDGLSDDKDDDCTAGDKGCGCASTTLPDSVPLVVLMLMGLAARRRE